MSIAIVATIYVTPGLNTEFENAFASLAAAVHSAAEPGALLYQVRPQNFPVAGSASGTASVAAGSSFPLL